MSMLPFFNEIFIHKIKMIPLEVALKSDNGWLRGLAYAQKLENAKIKEKQNEHV